METNIILETNIIQKNHKDSHYVGALSVPGNLRLISMQPSSVILQ